MQTNEIIDVTGDDDLTPVLPLRDVVVYPHMVIPLFVGREKSIEALDKAMQENKQILLVSQKEADLDEPQFDELHTVGTLANILQLLKLPDGTVKVLVEGEQRSQVVKYHDRDGCIFAEISEINDVITLSDKELDVLVRATVDSFSTYVKLNSKIPPEVLNALSGIDETGRLADTMAAHMSLKVVEKQELLEMADIVQRLEKLMLLMESEADLFSLEKNIRVRVKQQMDKNQREYYLNEQMKAIQKELGEMDDAVSEIEELEQKIAKAGMSKEAKEKAGVELNKLKMMSPMSAEASVVRNYLDWMINVPWKKKTKVRNDLKLAEEILDIDHYGLEKVKERILEYLAVQQRVKSLNGPILCLVGPPGVGKTSLGESIARATNRKYVRMALGGVRDEAEIRGHRRTYIGSMPGKILQNMSKIKVRNPLFLLDEIDKMSGDFRGDPASALLEVLDPEQNKAFADHYLEVDFDLSDVMFVATANTMNIPGPLLDRMEVIRLAGYTEDEKINIAMRYLLPKQLKNNGLKDSEVEIEQDVIRDIVRYYTREAGVRSLEREISKICRKVVKELLLKEKRGHVSVTAKIIADYLGVRRFSYGLAEEQDQIGQVTGLAWTEVGGELLTIEAVAMPGKGKQSTTGTLGDVMKESIAAAITVVRARAETLGIKEEAFQQQDLHIHVPEGATPKDGPSAGIGMCTAIISALTGVPVKAEVAMTGEITLRGEVLPIGGLKEKLLAAHRGGIKTVIIPAENEKDLAEIPDNVKQNLTIKPVRWIDQVLEIALQYQPEPLKKLKQTVDKTALKADEKSIRAH
ncbi:endopeptidase La [Methyloprofundus sp.]|uniref:endopeptidase La n=1 Tax=Methyloprofundus sp. TaxID=2020875 RepID=UPI003D0E03C5